MFIEMNKKKLKRVWAGAFIVFGVVSVAAGWRILGPGGGALSGGIPAAERHGGTGLFGMKERAAAGQTESTPVNWGLSFPEEGKPPVGNASAEQLKEYHAFYWAGNPEEKGTGGDSGGDDKSSDNHGAGDNGEDHGQSGGDDGAGTGKKSLYLTFDAGFENGYTADILDVLKKEKVPAAFFLVGTYLKENPELIKRMAAEGHLVGNHTMTHPDMSAIADDEAFRRELAGVEKEYQEITGKKMKKFYRPPQGKFSFANLQQAEKLGYTTVFWSLAYVDWYVDQQPTREEAMAKLMPRTHPGAVILLHSTSKTNAQILSELIGRWKKEGYTFKSIEDIESGS